ncbi:MAG: 23S rRNA (uracil(1939)-C(5))-methyltransferase RlmD [Myxococcales bacterium]|nr:23S rRNA (uracil(1939)-C(5))-methyltransferase RlmD [Myxococcales bacterium]
MAWPHAPRWGEQFDIEITGVDDKGRGTGHLSLLVGPQRLPRDYVVAIRTTVIGDRVQTTVGKPRRGKIDGQLTALLRPSDDRIAPTCAHFGPYDRQGRGCGGCSLQALNYPSQLTLKRSMVARALSAVDEGLIADTVKAPTAWYYRNKMEFSFGDDDERKETLGMHPAGFRYEVMDLYDCRLASKEAMDLVAAARRIRQERGLQHHDQRRDTGWLRTLTIREGKRTAERLVEVTTADREQVSTADGQTTPDKEIQRFSADLLAAAAELGITISSLWWTVHRARRGERTKLTSTPLHGTPFYREQLHVPGCRPLAFEVHPRAFFQPNTLQAEVLYGLVLAALGEQKGSAHVLDLYCGTGTIGLCLAQRVRKVTGIELSPEAVDNARANAQRNEIENITFHCGDVATVLKVQGLDVAGVADAVVVDPPRAGLGTTASAQLIQLAVHRLVYVSCNPTALGRDLAQLTAGGYLIDSVTPVDHFPQTAHVETIVALTYAGAPSLND